MIQSDTTPAALQQLIAQGYSSLQQGRLEEAAKLSESLLHSYPRHIEALFFASECRLAHGNARAALATIELAVAIAPHRAALHLKQANILFLLRKRFDARQSAQNASQTAKGDGRILWAIGKFYTNVDDPACALTFYEKAASAGVKDPGLLYDMAAAHFFLGEFETAEKALDTMLENAPNAGHALYLRSTVRRQTPAQNHIADLEARIASGFDNPFDHSGCLFAFAKELEDLHEDERSIASLNQAAAIKSSTLQYDLASELKAIESIRAAYTAEVMSNRSRGYEIEGPIFIVGMPRTGTTLVDRILSRHDDVSSAGELMDFGQILASAAQKCLRDQPGKTLAEASLSIDFEALGRDYIESARQAAPQGRFFVDKMPINYMYCGLIRKALPMARIVHLVRDPMDSCYAVYKTLFNQAYHFSYDQQELADYYVAYRRLMQHWYTVMPGEILNVRYEELVTDTEGQARRILNRCNLDWRPQVLLPSGNTQPANTASAAQVREPIHAGSIGKWRRYASGLEPMRARLVASDAIEV